MNHPTENELLLLAFGELREAAASELDSHVASCPACQEQLAQLERARIALDVAKPARRPVTAWAALALAATAVLVGVLIGKPGAPRGAERGWTPTTTWSATAGYVAGGKAMVDIDAQLTRLEQERYNGRP